MGENLLETAPAILDRLLAGAAEGRQGPGLPGALVGHLRAHSLAYLLCAFPRAGNRLRGRLERDVIPIELDDPDARMSIEQSAQEEKQHAEDEIEPQWRQISHAP